MQFARVSGLEGDHCCVKAGRRGWKGEEYGGGGGGRKRRMKEGRIRAGEAQ